MEKKAWSVSEYINLLQTQSTKNNYYVHLKQFFEHINSETIPRGGHEKLDSLSLRYWSEERDPERDIASFYNSLKGYAPKSKSLKLGAVKAYYEVNGVQVSKVILQSLNGKKSNSAISVEKVPNKAELRRIIEHLPLHGKALTLFLSSSGMRIGEALKVQLNDIDFDSQPTKIRLRGGNTKTGQKRFTFISAEATESLRDWLEYRPTFNEKNSKRMDAKSRKKYLERMQSTVFSFTRFNFSKLWKAALEKTDLYEVDIDTGRVTLRPHNLRKYFRTHGRWSNPDVPEALMGHQSGVVNIYARFDSAEEILKEGYLVAEPNLSIYESTANVIALRNQVDQQSEDIQRLITNLSLENARLKLDLEGLKKSFRELEVIEMRMNTLEANQNDIITNPEYVNIMKFFSENHKEIERFLKNRDK